MSMMDDKLAIDEARRAHQHENVKAEVEANVNEDIAAQAQEVTPQESAAIGQIAQNFRHKAVNEVAETERDVERSRVLTRVSQITDYIFYVIYALLAVRLLLSLMAARRGAGFVQLINTLTEPFYAPFKGIVGSPSIEGGYTLALPIIVALIVYVLLHAGINGLLRLGAHRKVAI